MPTMSIYASGGWRNCPVKLTVELGDGGEPREGAKKRQVMNKRNKCSVSAICGGENEAELKRMGKQCLSG